MLTIDVEEWFEDPALAGILSARHRDRFGSRVALALDAWLELLERLGARATFFVSLEAVEGHLGALCRVAAAGHELAVRDTGDPGDAAGAGGDGGGAGAPGRVGLVARLRATAAAIEERFGARPVGCRPPHAHAGGSTGPTGLRALLARAGFRYRSQLEPGRAATQPVPSAGPGSDAAGDGHGVGSDGATLVEVPVARFAGWFVPRRFAHGAAVRALSLRQAERALRVASAAGAAVVLSFASWELDSDHPVVTAGSRRARARHYSGLAELPGRLERLLAPFRPIAIADLLACPWRPDPAAMERALAAAGAGPSATPVPGPARASGAVASPLAVVVPMFRERENVAFVLRALRALAERLDGRWRLRFVFVDDGSDDGTFETLRAECAGRDDVVLLRHEENRGVAAAIMTGIRAVDTELVCSIDSDCSYDPLVLETMLAASDGADLVTASPYHPDGRVVGVPRWRLFLSRGLSHLYRRALGAPVHTWTSCVRVWRRSSVRDLPLEHGGFLGIAELLIRVLRAGGVVRDHPARLESRLLGFSKMKTLRTIRGHLGLLWRIARGRL